MARPRKPAASKAAEKARRAGAGYETRRELRAAVEEHTGRIPDDLWIQIEPEHTPPYDAAELQECLEPLLATDWWLTAERKRVRALFHALGGEFHVIEARHTRVAVERLGQHLALADWVSDEGPRRRGVSDRELMAIGRMALLAAFSESRYAHRHEARQQFFSSMILEADADGPDSFRQWLESLSTKFVGTLSASIDAAGAWVGRERLQLALIDQEVQRVISEEKFGELLRDQLESAHPPKMSVDEFFAQGRATASWSEQFAVARTYFGVEHERADSYRRAVVRARQSFPAPAPRLRDTREEIAYDEARLRALVRPIATKQPDS